MTSMPADGLPRAASLRHTPDNWQQQVEELVALQAILPTEFRILHIPGRPNTPPIRSSSSPPDSSSSSSLQPEQPPLEDLLLLEPPQDSGLIVCQLTAQLDPLETPLQLVIRLPSQPEPPVPHTPAPEAGASSSSSSSNRSSSNSRQHHATGANDSSNGSSSNSKQLEAPSTAADTSRSSSATVEPKATCSSSNGSTAAASKQGSQEQQVLIGSPVRHLPPLTLHLVFPVTYPNQEPPDVRVTGSWLGPQQQQQLAAALLASWEEDAPGAPVCYQWLEWVRSSALQYLGISDTLVIPVSLQDADDQELAEPGSSPGAAGPHPNPAAAGAGAGAGAGAVQQPAAAAACVSQEQVAAYMSRCEQVALQVLSHDATQEQAAFEASSWPCAICLDQVLGSKCIRVAPCRHVFCHACLASYCASLVGEGAVQQLRCPDPSCRSSLLPDQVRQLLTPEQFARWEELLLTRTLDAMPDLVYCPRCEAACIEDKDHCAQCPECLYAFCSLCGDSWHPGNPCLSEEHKLLVLARRKERNGGQNVRREADMVAQLLSLKLLAKNTRKCPGCGVATEKVFGCNKMTCVYCDQMWCWRCGAAVTGYEHFGADTCVLFEDDMVRQWNAQMGAAAERVAVGQVRLELPGARPCRCPVCGQHNAKVGGNNLIRCWACNHHFCYSCCTWLRVKVGAHFLAGTCKQHSDD